MNYENIRLLKYYGETFLLLFYLVLEGLLRKGKTSKISSSFLISIWLQISGVWKLELCRFIIV